MTQRWLFSPGVDVLAFAGTALLSFALVLLLPSLGVGADTPPWAFLIFVVFIDVAHVWSTLFRVYLDKAELQRRPLLYAGAPLLAYGLGVAVHSISAEAFWRVLAYIAAWHFIRQQVGWMVLYGRRAGQQSQAARDDAERSGASAEVRRPSNTELNLDRAAIYAATLGPVVWWHAHLPRAFWWFREGDFVSGLPQWVGTLALGIHAVVLVGWLAQALVLRRFHLGKTLLLFATWLSWFGGIVLAQSDLAFTVMNVALHGVPYLVLLHRYAKGRDAEGGYGRLSWLLRAGLPGFLVVLWVLAFFEEFAWDRLVWHDHPMLFGAGGFEVEGALLALLVPLLSLPQTTHYLLDGFIWKTKADPHLTARLGWAPAPHVDTVAAS
ncbi:MAG: hypothetical protein Q8L48_37790 [Archangium sp.]|nr:hypothetical protein [Archangium sp.]